MKCVINMKAQLNEKKEKRRTVMFCYLQKKEKIREFYVIVNIF